MTQLSFLDLCDAARTAVGRGDLLSGKRHFEAALELKSDAVEAHYGLATICYLLREFPQAIEQFQEVQRLDPMHAGACINLGALLNLQGQYEDAIIHLRKGIALDHTRSEGYYNLGIAYRKLGRFELAIQAYREAHHLNPRLVEAVYNLANVYFEMERHEQAINHYRKALDISPNFNKARQGIARAEQKLRELQSNVDPLDSEYEAATTNLQGVTAATEIDTRLDRLMDPERDLELMTNLFADTDECHRQTIGWLRATEKLDAAVRSLAVHLTNDAGTAEVIQAVKVLRAAMDQCQQIADQIGVKFDTIGKLRDQLIAHG